MLYYRAGNDIMNRRILRLYSWLDFGAISGEIADHGPNSDVLDLIFLKIDILSLEAVSVTVRKSFTQDPHFKITAL